jgi:hypothetical protein
MVHATPGQEMLRELLRHHVLELLQEPTAGLNPLLFANERGEKGISPIRLAWCLRPQLKPCFGICSPCRGRRRKIYEYSTEWTGRDGHEDTRKGGPCFLFIPRGNANRKRESQVVFVFVNKRKL